MNQFFVGLDLGQANDYTAIVVAERLPGPPDETPARLIPRDSTSRTMPAGPPNRYHVRHLERPRLGTTYPRIADRVLELAEMLHLVRVSFSTGCLGPPVVV